MGKLSKSTKGMAWNEERTLQPYEKRSIYQEARKLLRDIHVIASRMSKMHKYQLGTTLCKYTQELTEAIFIAYDADKNDVHTKLRLIGSIPVCLQKIMINCRIAHDLQQLETSDYEIVLGRFDFIQEKTGAWSKYICDASGLVTG